MVDTSPVLSSDWSRGVSIRLVNWEEGNYRVTDRPRPRGEILISGGNVTAGYYKQPGKTREEYFTDEAGLRWFKSGDIGQVSLQYSPLIGQVISIITSDWSRWRRTAPSRSSTVRRTW